MRTLLYIAVLALNEKNCKIFEDPRMLSGLLNLGLILSDAESKSFEVKIKDESSFAYE